MFHGLLSSSGQFIVINSELLFLQLGIEMIRRAAAPNDHPLFIDALTDLVKSNLHSNQLVSPKFLTRCPHCTNARCHQTKSWFAKLCT